MKFIDPKTDYAFKKIFSSAQSKNILISFLNALLYEGQNTIRDLEFIDTYEPGSVAILKDSYLDVRAKLDNGSTVIIEMQVLNIEGFNKQVIYYAAKVYVNQLQRGKIYTGLKPVISLTIADFTMFKESEKIITRFAFKEWDNSFVYPDSDIELFFVELPKFKKKLANLENITDKWLYFMKHTNSLEVVPESMELVPEISQAFTIANEANLTIDELQQLEKQEQFIIDRKGAIAFSKEEGREEGKIEGREEGKIEGREEGRKELILSLIERLLGTIDANIKERFNQLSNRELEELIKIMLEFKNISDLVAWLDKTRH
ncbi:MAG: Rpn family recombination-promoting nuclease/putative transposase [Okeania sp. SIO3B5]|uniref:Rpn family recombination-promoting nuclease/putative transposase n=1 Tax=Okeania sp. SIO3B5 TaxID=2607811 RepID=UPI0013FF2EDC|nr:Rpn family recombination-promoting nuclease/putative transposase [Okeania sp. SIO3B5]NEO55813.1 Rpn family recombination-promoting nuclease/putative transposase [Okeania sp. SIO3B5]